MTNDEIRQLQNFFAELVNFPFLLNAVGIYSKKDAEEFVASYQEEEQILEHFLSGLINQSMFYPVSPNKWMQMAKLCNYDHPAILDECIDLPEGGPVNDWYIYPRFIKWLHKNAPNVSNLDFGERDQVFLNYEMPQAPPST
jgi:hypothetical protein